MVRTMTMSNHPPINNDNDGDGNSAMMDSEVIKREQHQKQQHNNMEKCHSSVHCAQSPSLMGCWMLYLASSYPVHPSIKACEVPAASSNLIQ